MEARRACAHTYLPTRRHVKALYAVPLHTHFLCEERLTPDLIESWIKGSFWLRFRGESWPQHFNYSVSISTQAHRHFINSIMDAMTEFIWVRVIEVKEENEQRWRETTFKRRKWDKKDEREWIGVFSQDHFKKMTAYQIPLFPLTLPSMFYLACLICLLPLFVSVLSPTWSPSNQLPPLSTPPLLSSH